MPQARQARLRLKSHESVSYVGLEPGDKALFSGVASYDGLQPADKMLFSANRTSGFHTSCVGCEQRFSEWGVVSRCTFERSA